MPVVRTNLRCVLVGVGLAACVFLAAQIVSLFLIHSPSSNSGKILTRNTHDFSNHQAVKQNVNLENKAQMGEEKCQGWNCDDAKDNDDKRFHPRNIGRQKSTLPHDGILDNHILSSKQILDKNKPGRVKDTINVGNKINVISAKLKENNVIVVDGKNRAENIAIPRGVLAADAEKYLLDANDLFTCLVSKEKIPALQLNDDYCDCQDGTDEPGTSACSPRSKFHCTFQGDIGASMIFSSRVNDGICDCCDGSDEYSTDIMHPQLRDAGNVLHAPCENTCQDLVEKAQQKMSDREEGLRIKERYIKAGQGHNTLLYGEEGEFYLLHDQCFYFVISKYDYKVCPFQEVTQGEGRDLVTIGKDPRWLSHTQEEHVLVMENGSSINCPNPPRNTKIHFVCGLTDEILRIEESETCRYTVRFSTPAAC